MAFSTGLSIVKSIQTVAKDKTIRGLKAVPAAITHFTIAPVVDEPMPRRWVGAADLALGVAALALGILLTTGTLHLPLPSGVGMGLTVGGGISIGLALLSLAANKGQKYVAKED